MPIIHKNDVTPERPVIIVLYGTPGSGKTSLATTTNNPLIIDTDRGYDRAVQRVDTLAANCWADIDSERAAMASYDTIVVDTAKAMLDDYLSQYAVEKNYKLKTNSLKRFGQMADDFKEFVNYLRSMGKDIVFICHDKEVAEGDIIRHTPDCTGQSKELLQRIADQVGYVSIHNGQRVVSFDPADTLVGKNVAEIKPIAIPDATTPEFKTFGADIIYKVKAGVQNKSEAQRMANELLSSLRDRLADVTTDKGAAGLLTQCADMPNTLKKPFFDEIKKVLEGRGFEYVDKKFTKRKKDGKAAD